MEVESSVSNLLNLQTATSVHFNPVMTSAVCRELRKLMGQKQADQMGERVIYYKGTAHLNSMVYACVCLQ